MRESTLILGWNECKSQPGTGRGCSIRKGFECFLLAFDGFPPTSQHRRGAIGVTASSRGLALVGRMCDMRNGVMRGKEVVNM